MTTNRKKCNKCGIPKKLNQYYRSPGATDGHKGHCKACYRKKPVETNGLATGASCYHCVFETHCRHNVKVKDVDWNPPCFATSQEHEAYVKEYGRRVAV